MAEKGEFLGSSPHSTPKGLVHIAGKPLIEHILNSISKLKIDKAIFIVDENYSELREILKNYSFESVFIKQKEKKGVGHAIYGARKHCKNDDVLILLGDSLIEVDWKNFPPRNCEGLIWTMKVKDPSNFGVVFKHDGFVTRLLEKPDNPISDEAIVGLYYFSNSNEVFDSLNHIISNEITNKGEYQLTDAIQFMISKGLKIKSLEVVDWYDCGNIPHILNTNRYLLSENKSRVSEVENSVILKPVYIEKGAIIKNSIIGPFVSVGRQAVIKNSIIKESIINESAVVEDASLKECMIGKKTIIRGNAKKLNVGDNSEIHYT